jgi:hypothetical protein
MYIERLPQQPISKSEVRQWRREFARAFLKGPVHEFRTGGTKYFAKPSVSKLMETWEGEMVTTEISYRKPKNKKVYENVVGCLWHKLADSPGMVLSDFRDRIEGYAYSYNAGFDPLTGDSLKDVKSFEFYTQKKNDKGEVISIEEKKVPKALDELQTSKDMDAVAEPYGAKRNNVVPDEDVMKLLLGLICDDDFKRKVDNLKKKKR